MKTTTQDHVHRQRTAHHSALERLYTGRKLQSGLQIWRQLRKIECLASQGATAYCNGGNFTCYLGKSRMLFSFQVDENAWDSFSRMIKSRVEKCLGTLPDGFFVNGDPRGYALKLDNDKVTIPEGMHTDWGRYGILAPEIN